MAGNEETDHFVCLVRDHLAEGPVTLLFGAKDTEHNQAVVLKEFLAQR